MDAILARSSNNVLAQIQGTPNNPKKIIPWLGQSKYNLDLRVFKKFTQGKILWCTLPTYMSLPLAVRSDPNRAFKILSKAKTGFTPNPITLEPIKAEEKLRGVGFVDVIPTYTFQDLEDAIDNLGSSHVLIGGPTAYNHFLGKCKNIVETHIKAIYRGQNICLKIPPKESSYLAYSGPTMQITFHTTSWPDKARLLEECGLS
jgi:dihydrofolate reductase